MNRSRRTLRQQGFTLIEVLVALTVIAISMAAISRAGSSQASNALYLKQKTLGHWVASNAANQMILDKEWPSLGKSTDSSEMAGHEWFIKREVVKTASPDTRQVIYQIYADEELQQPVSRLVSYVTDPRFLSTEPAKSTP